VWLTRALGILTPDKGQAAEAVEVPVVPEPEIPQRPPAPPPESPRTEAAGYAAALECVRLVIAWYNRAIYLEERSPAPDRERLDGLISERRACVTDRKYLADAEASEVARMSLVYGRKLRRLLEECPAEWGASQLTDGINGPASSSMRSHSF